MAIRCLIVDDNPRFARTAQEILQEDGIEVLGVAASGEQAVRLARELRPDLALVDIDLGAENGLAVAQRLCGDEQQPLAESVILISTHAEEEFAELIAASPAVGFLAKAELSADAIEALLSRAGRARTA
jgi:DNA-binding NarL/FixJ family response regulator